MLTYFSNNVERIDSGGFEVAQFIPMCLKLNTAKSVSLSQSVRSVYRVAYCVCCCVFWLGHLYVPQTTALERSNGFTLCNPATRKKGMVYNTRRPGDNFNRPANETPPICSGGVNSPITPVEEP